MSFPKGHKINLGRKCPHVSIRMRTHGLSRLPEYESWRNAKKRCYDLTDPYYPDYGGRGIRMCDRWLESVTWFAVDMGPRPSGSYSIERIDGNGHYEPGNCIWATATLQARNRRSNVFITAQGATHCISEWAEKLGIKPATLARRKRAGWLDEQIVGLPLQQKVRVNGRWGSAR